MSFKIAFLKTDADKVEELYQILHLSNLARKNGGVLGPAHPCGQAYMSFANTKRFYKNPEIMKRFDFVEVFNACEPIEVNEMAAKLAYKYGKPGVGGSDAHNATSCGMAYTELPEPITCETELIELIRKKDIKCYQMLKSNWEDKYPEYFTYE